jgi:hypothetical protein
MGILLRWHLLEFARREYFAKALDLVVRYCFNGPREWLSDDGIRCGDSRG